MTHKFFNMLLLDGASGQTALGPGGSFDMGWIIGFSSAFPLLSHTFLCSARTAGSTTARHLTGV